MQAQPRHFGLGLGVAQISPSVSSRNGPKSIGIVRFYGFAFTIRRSQHNHVTTDVKPRARTWKLNQARPAESSTRAIQAPDWTIRPSSPCITSRRGAKVKDPRLTTSPPYSLDHCAAGGPVHSDAIEAGPLTSERTVVECLRITAPVLDRLLGPRVSHLSLLLHKGEIYTNDVNTNINYNIAAEAAAELYGTRPSAAYLGKELAKLQDRRLGALAAASFGRRHRDKNRKKIAERPIPNNNRWRTNLNTFVSRRRRECLDWSGLESAWLDQLKTQTRGPAEAGPLEPRSRAVLAACFLQTLSIRPLAPKGSRGGL
jgi:hypothetical protein